MAEPDTASLTPEQRADRGISVALGTLREIAASPSKPLPFTDLTIADLEVALLVVRKAAGEGDRVMEACRQAVNLRDSAWSAAMKDAAAGQPSNVGEPLKAIQTEMLEATRQAVLRNNEGWKSAVLEALDSASGFPVHNHTDQPWVALAGRLAEFRTKVERLSRLSGLRGYVLDAAKEVVAADDLPEEIRPLFPIAVHGDPLDVDNAVKALGVSESMRLREFHEERHRHFPCPGCPACPKPVNEQQPKG